MRLLMLHSDDFELFGNMIDGDNKIFFCTHFSAFKRMWLEQGKMFWLRFLLTFEGSFFKSIENRSKTFDFLLTDDGERLMDFIFIYIHKNFVECTFSATKIFMENIFVAAKHFSSLLETNRMKSPFYIRESREAFRTILGKPNVDDDIPVGIIAFVCSIYFEFSGSICVLLKRWLQESDLTEAAKKTIDFTMIYWRPPQEWDCDHFPSCFQKYLASYWKEELPKMLLTCNIHNIFNEHDCADFCCDYKNDMNIFDLFKDRLFVKDQPFVDDYYCIKDVETLQLSVAPCKAHEECYMKVKHAKECKEPFLCNGKKPCQILCEEDMFDMHCLLEDTKKPFWKKIEVATYATKKGKRNMATLAQSHDDFDFIETFLPMSEEYEQGLVKKQELTSCVTDMLYLSEIPELKNALNQQKKKEQVKSRLRTKLCKKNKFDFKNYKDKSFCMEIFNKARDTFITQMGHDNFKQMVGCCHACVKEESLFGNPISIQRAMTSVAISTNDIVTGRIVFCTGHSANAEGSSNVQSSQLPKNKSVFKSKKVRKRKKANSSNGSSDKTLESCANGVPKSVPQGFDSVPTSSDIFLTKKITSERQATNENVTQTKSDKTLLAKASCDSVQCSSTKKDVQETKDTEHKINDSDSSLKKDQASQCESAITNNIIKNLTFVNCKKIIKGAKTKVNAIQTVLKNSSNSDKLQISAGTDSVANSTKNTSEEINNKQLPFIREVKDNLENIDLQKPIEPQSSETTCDIDLKQSAESSLDLSKKEIALDVSDPENKEDKVVDDFLTLVGGVLNPHRQDETINSADTKIEDKVCEKKMKLRTCAYCGKNETECRTFKRCSKCKIEKFTEQHYYCSRECQVDDWEESHRDEHQKKSSPSL